MSDDREPDWPGPPDDGGRPDPAAIDAQLPAVEAHCRAVTGREDEAVRAAGVVIESARSLLTDPERLRAWLLANARRELLGDAAPTAQDAFDLVHRHGIQPEDLPVVLGMPPTEADELLAAAEEELGWGTNWSDTAYANEGNPDLPAVGSSGGMFDTQLLAVVAYCRAVTGREDDAVSAAGVVIESARSLLTDPQRLRAWLLANARRELLGDAAPTAQEAFDLVHRHGIQPEDLPVVLGMPPTEADELLAAAEEELGWGTNWSDTAYANEGNPDLPAVGSSGGMFDTQLLAVVAYCRAVTGREDDAVSAAGVVIESARSLLTDPERLRAWLLANARRELLGDAAPTAQDAFDLVHRHGIQPEDLPVVLGMPPTEADELLAAAEEELGWGTNWSDTAYANEGNPDLPAVGSSGGMFDTQLLAVVAYCRAVTGREDDAVSAAGVVIESARSLLTDPQRLRAWLLANARRELLGDAAPTAQEAFDLVHRHGIQPEDLPVVL